jgi:hypothetical protein
MKIRTFTVIVIALMLLAQTLPAASVDGKWHFVFETPLGNRESDIEIATQGERALAKTAKQEYNGTFKDDVLDVAGETHSQEGDVTAELRIKGKLDGDKITGEATFAGYTMAFNASRVKQ